MDISKNIARIKELPEFTENVGMILVHNGVVRSWSREDHSPVAALEVIADQKKIEEIRREFLAWKGIFAIQVEALSGTFYPGDDLLFIVVAGDIRENVKPALAGLIDRIKAEGVRKRELPADNG